MAGTSTKYAQTIVSTGSWSNFTTTYLGADDASRTTTNATSYTAGVVRNFNFSAIPAGSIIDSVTVGFKLSASSASRTAKARFSATLNGGTSWSSTTTERSVTGATETAYSDAISITPTLAQIQDTTNFQVKCEGYISNGSYTCRIGYISITVAYHTENGVSGEITAGSGVAGGVHYGYHVTGAIDQPAGATGAVKKDGGLLGSVTDGNKKEAFDSAVTTFDDLVVFFDAEATMMDGSLSRERLLQETITGAVLSGTANTEHAPKEHEITGAIEGGTVQGNVTGSKTAAGSISQGAVAGSARNEGRASGDIAGGAVAGATKKEGGLSASVSGATVSGTGKKEAGVVGAASQGTVVGAVSVDRVIAGGVSIGSGAVGAVKLERAIQGAISAPEPVTGSLTYAGAMTADVNAGAILTGEARIENLGVEKLVSGAIDAGAGAGAMASGERGVTGMVQPAENTGIAVSERSAGGGVTPAAASGTTHRECGATGAVEAAPAVGAIRKESCTAGSIESGTGSAGRIFGEKNTTGTIVHGVIFGAATKQQRLTGRVDEGGIEGAGTKNSLIDGVVDGSAIIQGRIDRERLLYGAIAEPIVTGSIILNTHAKGNCDARPRIRIKMTTPGLCQAIKSRLEAQELIAQITKETELIGEILEAKPYIQEVTEVSELIDQELNAGDLINQELKTCAKEQPS
jgi:hypothetical protein